MNKSESDYIYEVNIERGENLPKKEGTGKPNGFVVMRFYTSNKAKREKLQNYEESRKKEMKENENDEEKPFEGPSANTLYSSCIIDESKFEKIENEMSKHFKKKDSSSSSDSEEDVDMSKEIEKMKEKNDPFQMINLKGLKTDKSMMTESDKHKKKSKESKKLQKKDEKKMSKKAYKHLNSSDLKIEDLTNADDENEKEKEEKEENEEKEKKEGSSLKKAQKKITIMGEGAGTIQMNVIKESESEEEDALSQMMKNESVIQAERYQQLDEYYFEVTKMFDIPEKTVQTYAIMNNPNPVWNSRFLLHHLAFDRLEFELYDYFYANRIHNLATCLIYMRDFTFPIKHLEINWELNMDGIKKSIVDEEDDEDLDFLDDASRKELEKKRKKEQKKLEKTKMKQAKKQKSSTIKDMIQKQVEKTLEKQMAIPNEANQEEEKESNDSDDDEDEEMKNKKRTLVVSIGRIYTFKKTKEKCDLYSDERKVKIIEDDQILMTKIKEKNLYTQVVLQEMEAKKKDKMKDSSVQAKESGRYSLTQSAVRDIITKTKEIEKKKCTFVLVYNDDKTIDFHIISKDKNANMFIICHDENGNYLNRKCMFTLTRKSDPFKKFNKMVRYHLCVKQIPLFNDLSNFKIVKLNQVFLDPSDSKRYTDLSEIIKKKGWKGKMSYYQASASMKNDVYFINEDQRILFDERKFLIGLKDHGEMYEIAFYPKQGENIQYCFIDTPENKILMFDKPQKFPCEQVQDEILTKIYTHIPYPCIFKNIRLMFFENDPKCEPKPLTDFIPFVDPPEKVFPLKLHENVVVMKHQDLMKEENEEDLLNVSEMKDLEIKEEKETIEVKEMKEVKEKKHKEGKKRASEEIKEVKEMKSKPKRDEVESESSSSEDD